MDTQKRKSAQLGMPFGTANHRLKKNIMFDMMVRLEEDTCFKCGEKIQSADQLSIEHRVPWLDVSTDLFWDLDNIAFSHLACNRPNRPKGGGPKGFRPSNTMFDRGPQGTSWCGKCKSFLPFSEFHLNSKRTVGVHHHCKICRKRES